MNANDLFTMLAIGELQNLSLATGGVISEAARPRLFMYTNDALLELHSKFPLKENDLLLQLSDYVTYYHLLPQYAVNGPGSEKVRYILDRVDAPFQDDLIKVKAVFNKTGDELPLNDDSHPESLFTPQFKTLQVPRPKDGDFLTVVYQQSHKKLQGNLDENIDCPDVLLPALKSYIAFKVFDHMNSTESVAKAQGFLSAYETACNGVVDRDLVSSSITQTNIRFSQGGWI